MSLIALAGICAGMATWAMPASESSAQLLERAASIKTTDHDEFLRILAQLHEMQDILPADQLWSLRFLDAWQAAFEGNDSRAVTALRVIAEQASSPAVRLRSLALMVNIFGFSHRYEEAFIQLNRLTELLPQVSDKGARYAALGEAAQLLIFSHHYKQALEYADQMLQNLPTGKNGCHAAKYRLQALVYSGDAQLTTGQFQQAIDLCTQDNDWIYAAAVRNEMAAFLLQQGRATEAIRVMEEHYDEVRNYQYSAQTQYTELLLAEGYFSLNDLAKARKFALASIDSNVENTYSEPLSKAYELLYRIENKLGHKAEALTYHEKYMAADKGYLSDATAGALAYETIKQQVQAQKNQVDVLNRENQILQLQRQLDSTAVKTGRLYIALLLTVLVSAVLWLFRVKRSQLRFKRLATQDSLTNICSRQHFVDETELVLRQAGKVSRSACLILLDLDHFKQVNDTHGHVMGDLVLKRAVAACQHHLRSSDLFGRLGGEEFAIMMPDCSATTAVERAERIREAIAATPLWGETRHVVITASFGVACTDASGFELRQLMIDADNALYRAKRGGRNCVVYGDEPDATKSAATSAHASTDEATATTGAHS
ncbi:GGDEF domain-containing protein [Dyella solisilvae]|uniref:diguanylate cyclase n=1 Tax=Dyella solisilvae TaxID=1920168 RepID=A0A370K7N3_9GAMM|nr:GGDEF domain-containing protein [Dyella solisilvae]RDI98659.1 GGDEF domain-containing protein [Dyella solisilvae]